MATLKGLGIFGGGLAEGIGSARKLAAQEETARAARISAAASLPAETGAAFLRTGEIPTGEETSGLGSAQRIARGPEVGLGAGAIETILSEEDVSIMQARVKEAQQAVRAKEIETSVTTAIRAHKEMEAAARTMQEYDRAINQARSDVARSATPEEQEIRRKNLEALHGEVATLQRNVPQMRAIRTMATNSLIVLLMREGLEFEEAEALASQAQTAPDPAAFTRRLLFETVGTAKTKARRTRGR